MWFTVYLAASLVSKFRTVKFRPGTFVAFTICTISSSYRKTTGKTWKWRYQRWFEEMPGSRMESRANLEHSVYRNSTTFSDVPLLPEIFRWNVQKSRVPFNFQPDFLQSVWMVNNRSEFHCGTVFWDKFWPQSVIRYFPMPIIHLVYPPRVLHKHCFQFLLGFTILPRTWKQYLCKNLWGEQGVLWLMWK